MSIHPSMLPLLDPEYVAHHNSNYAHLPALDSMAWDPAIRENFNMQPDFATLPVEKTEDFELDLTRLRAYTPSGEPPEGGWPALLYIHGGGWTLGNISSEAPLMTNICASVRCVVVAVDYRLAPEDPYPAAVNDCVAALLWLVRQGPQKLHINPARIAVGGTSSGGNLAAVLALKASTLQIPKLILQVLIVPITDNTATVATSWESKKYAPFLTPDVMMWFRHHYLPDPETWTNWDASPLFATADQIRALPKTLFILSECDILCEEAEQYAKKIKREGVDVEVKIYKGAPHNGVLHESTCVGLSQNLS
ncbi:hypothetical protein H0H81_009393 [Sphagnurus paluster]|uniref:Alpha/beta hydrolase fold-3 domain-containing protein n=1 Tax=Sphagnurus paluster TaxID=117069 RepID=A0A9P7K415_9AGAR|nr:hypothetical protein H0H81_009393 [Sphagnurus paluster]